MNLEPVLSRRTLLVIGAAGAGTVALAACGSDADSSDPTTPAGPQNSPGTTSASSAPATTAAGSPGSAGDALATLGDIKVGEAVSAELPDGSPIVVARPTESTVAAFTAKCTHRGCTVKPDGGTLKCPCHGSAFNALTGEVVNGPAQDPLAAIPVRVVNGAVVPGGPTG